MALFNRIIRKLKFYILLFVFAFFALSFTFTCFSQEKDLELCLDAGSNTIPLPKIFMPSIDLSGRGFHTQKSWPQTLAAEEVLNLWQKEMGFSGLYRLQYNLWEINERAKDNDLQDKLLSNYENVIKKINDAGGVVILNIFGTPAGLGRVLDKKNAPRNLKAFKELVKNHIRRLSCEKRYNIWYEVWSAPDLDDFFLGRKQEYLNLYRSFASAIKELEEETKIHIPVGGPSVSWWFQNFDGNTIVTPERSLVYELIKFCYRYKLPLDFITWHAYSTDPKAEEEITVYNKTTLSLIRAWLSYFKFDNRISLIVDEWNYDSGANVLPARAGRSYICASYIPARLKKMYEAGLDYQVYFSLEDFHNNKEGVIRNVGVFWFDAKNPEYRGGPKAVYNVFKMLANLGSRMFLASSKLNDSFVGTIATKEQNRIAILIYNYIDPDIAKNYLSKNIAMLKEAERRALLRLFKSDDLKKVMLRELDISGLRSTNRLKSLLRKAQELNDQAIRLKDSSRNIRITMKNLKGNYEYQRYAVDSSCCVGCEFSAVETKEIEVSDSFQETLTLSPYSVNLIVLKEKPKETKGAPQEQATTEKPVTPDNPTAPPDKE